MSQTLHEFLHAHRIHEVECVIPDMTGIARGKILPRDLFVEAGERPAKCGCPRACC